MCAEWKLLNNFFSRRDFFSFFLFSLFVISFIFCISYATIRCISLMLFMHAFVLEMVRCTKRRRKLLVLCAYACLIACFTITTTNNAICIWYIDRKREKVRKSPCPKPVLYSYPDVFETRFRLARGCVQVFSELKINMLFEIFHRNI